MTPNKTLEEAAHEYFKRGQLGLEKASDTEKAFAEGAEWEAKNSFSKEDMVDFALFYHKHQGTGDEYWGQDLFQVWKNDRDPQPTKTDSVDAD